MDDNQILVPQSFVDLFVPPGRIKPTESREHIAQRYELREGMAQILVDTVQAKKFELGVTEGDVIERIRQSLQAPGSLVTEAEAVWVATRLEELIGC